MNIIVIQYHYDDFCHYNHENDLACTVLPIIITITIITTITIVSRNPAPPGFFYKTPQKKPYLVQDHSKPLVFWKLHQGSCSAAASTECPQPVPRLWQGGAHQSSDESRMIII